MFVIGYDFSLLYPFPVNKIEGETLIMKRGLVLGLGLGNEVPGVTSAFLRVFLIFKFRFS